MRKLQSSLLITALALVGSQTAFATTYKIDQAHSSVGFTVRHLVSKVNGRFRDFDGEFNFDEKTPGSAIGKMTIQVKSINTENEKRDGHLQSPDFFDAAKYPTITFVSKKFSANGDKKFRLEGDMTMHGVTKPVTFDVEYLGSAEFMGEQRAGFTATSTVNRKDFGVNWNKTLDNGGVIVGEDVAITIQVEAPAKSEGKSKEAPKPAKTKK